MKHYLHHLNIFIFLSIAIPQCFAQNKIYINKATGIYKPNFGGSYSKTTDNYERGTVNITTTGPISYSVTPADLVIFELETKSWSGTITPVMADAPAPGDSANAKLSVNYSIVYSRPQEPPGGVTVLSTYRCPGCPAHTDSGTHQVVRKEGVNNYSFVLYGVDVIIPDTISVCSTGKAIVAEGFPAGGNFTFTITSGAANLSYMQVDSNSIFVDYDMWVSPYIYRGAIDVTYTVGGVSVTKTCVVKLPDVSPFTEYDMIRSFFCVIFSAAKPSFPTIGNGYFGNIAAGEGVCIILHDSLKAIHNRMLPGRTFCHFKLGMCSYFYTDYLSWGHMFVGCFDRKNKLYTYADPWKFNDCVFRNPPASSSTWTTAPW